jgi:hypothetical protein
MFATNGRAAPLWHLALNLMRSTTMEQCVFLVAACVASGPVHAGDVGEMQAASIQLQGFSGVVYYTSESGGYRVVATLSEGESGLPVRFEATLLDGQKLTISVPAKLGDQSHVVEMMRLHKRLVVLEPHSSEAASLPKITGVAPPKADPFKAVRQFDF